MRGLCLANADYSGMIPGSKGHTTDEGHQLQIGLEYAGWTLAGVGYGDGCADVPTLLDRYKPTHVFVQDVRDWLPESDISFAKNIGFQRIDFLRDCPDIRKVLVVKDAWGWHDIQNHCAVTIDADAIATYYAHDVVRREASWTMEYPLLRMHHSVDTAMIRSLGFEVNRKRACVTGARSPVYPLRMHAIKNASVLGLDTRLHPGYGNRGADTPEYLRFISGYRVHVATASKWEVAFRKIIESVACGCTPVTNLAASDVLPEIDAALVRIPTNATVTDIRDAVASADEAWCFEERMHWAEKAMTYYDWRAAGRRLSEEIGKL